MARYIVAAVVGALYRAASYWIVHTEGESFRDSLRKTRESAGPIAERKAQGSQERTIVPKADGRAGSLSATEPGAPPPEVASAEHHSEAKRGPVRKPAQPPFQSKDRVEPSAGAMNRALAKADRGRAPGANRAAPVDPAEPAVTAKVEAFRKANAYWNQDFLKKAWDVDRLASDTAMEIALGRELHDVIVDLNPTVEDNLLLRVMETAEPLKKIAARKDIPYTFTVLDTDAVNAFSHPGGYIYVTRGLFNLIGEDERYALEFVLGHEMAHIELKHAIKCLQDPGMKQPPLGPLGTIQKLYGVIIPSAYLDNQEFEADTWAFNRMKGRLDRSNRECLAFLNKLVGYATTHGFAGGRAKPKPGYSLIDNHLSAHTAPFTRLQHLKEIRDQASKPPK